jgi:uncharacterized membrane protein YccC
MILSRKAKEAIKTALAMAIAYAIALQMGWDRPYWAAFAVGMISLPAAGQSLRKGAMRMLGTLVAGVAALTLIALFPQERWWFMVFLSVYLGFCTYMMMGKKNQYFYQVCGFVCVIIAFDGGMNSLNAFDIAVLRVQETGMGILVYTLVCVFLWPQRESGKLIEAAGKLVAVQRDLFRTYRALLSDTGSGVDSRAQGMQEVALLAGLEQALDTAEVESYAVWEVRHQWRRYQRDSTALMETLGRWYTSFAEIDRLDLGRLLPNLEPLCAELELRFVQIERMLAANQPELMPQAISLEMNQTEVRALSHFQKAALAVSTTELNRLEVLSRSLFDCLQDINGFDLKTSAAPHEEAPHARLALDPDRMAAVIRVVSTLWLAFLIWVYVDPPGHTGFVTLATSFVLAFAKSPQLRVSAVFLPVFLSCVFAGGLYIFVMPHLSGYLQLGLMIFIATFAIGYLFSEPRQALSRAMGLIFFAVVTSIDNQQTYSFVDAASTTLEAMLVIALLVVTSYIPYSPRPEKAFLRLLHRFFRHAEFIVAQLALDRDQRKGMAGRWWTVLYQNDLLELPAKLGTWGAMIDPRAFPEIDAGQVQALVTSLQVLALRIKALVEARKHPQNDLLVRELLAEVRAWRIAIEAIFQRWAKRLEVDPGADLEQRLSARLHRLEQRINESLSLAEASVISNEDYENFYRVLGSYRGLSDAMLALAKTNGDVSLVTWQEARF